MPHPTLPATPPATPDEAPARVIRRRNRQPKRELAVPASTMAAMAALMGLRPPPSRDDEDAEGAEPSADAPPSRGRPASTASASAAG